MSFKNYENLDVTPETTSEEELEQLKKEYKVFDTRGMILCFAITTILTIASSMILYSNLNSEKVNLEIIMFFSVAYFVNILIIVLPSYCIIKKRDVENNIWIFLCGVDVFILWNAFIIGATVPVNGIVKNILLIIAVSTIILLIPIMFMIKKTDISKEY